MMKKNNCKNESGDNCENADFLGEIAPLAQKINCLDIERISDICVNEIPKLVGVRFASLYILNDNNILHLQKHNHPFPINKIVSLSQNPPSPMVMAAKSKKLLLIENIETYDKPVIKRSQRLFVDNYSTGNCVIVPLVCQGRLVGVLNLADKIDKSAFNYDHIAPIDLIRQLVGASIGNIKLFEKTQHLATTDGLTGLVNHRTFYEILEKELGRSRRYGGHISLIMIDIDNLKNVNDTYGHRVGDKVIREISRKIKGCVRQIDTAARYGGDEFAVILPNTLIEEALVVAQRMVDDVSDFAVSYKREQIKLSISVGLGQYESDINPEVITNCSDEALYFAKQSGKNRIKIYNSAN